MILYACVKLRNKEMNILTIEKLKEHEPLFGSWFIDSKISEGKASKFYKVYKTENGQIHYMGLKTVKFPSNEQEISAVISSGQFQNIDEYLNVLQDTITKNMQTMLSLRSNKNIVRFDNFTIIRESSCFYVIMLMELLTPLASHLSLDNISKSEVLKLGEDICSALEGFRQVGVIHHDIKSENIYVDSFGNYKLGDFGIFDSIFHNANDPSAYIAPELYNKTAVTDISSDIYSLGILLYKLLNFNRMPFLPLYPQPVSLPDREQAFMRCMRGDLFLSPQNADYELSCIIFKATAFNPAARYSSPALFLDELHAYALSPANVSNGAAFNTGTFEIGNENNEVRFDSYEAPDVQEDEYYNEYPGEDDDDDDDENKISKHWYYLVFALIIVLAFIVALIFVSGKKDDKTTTTTQETTTTAQETTTAQTTTEENTTEETTEEETTEQTTEETTTETTTQETTTETTTKETTTEKVTTTEPLTAPTLVKTNKKNGDKASDGRTYLKISSYNLVEIPQDEFFTEVSLTIGDNFGNEPVGTKAYIYQMSGATLLQKVPADVSCEISDDFGGDILCTVTVSDSDFYYEPDNFQYYLCFEEGAITSETAISLPLQIRVK